MSVGVQVLSDLIGNARRAGARAAEALLVETGGFRCRVDRGRIGSRDGFEEGSLEVRVWLEGGRTAWIRGGTQEGPSLLERALAEAADAPEDAFAGPMGQISVQGRGLGIDDRRYEALEARDKMEVLIGAEKAALQTDRRIRTEGFTYEDRRTRRVIVNTRGLTAEEWSTSYRITGTVRLGDGGDELVAREALAGRAFADIATLPFGANQAKRLVELVGTRPAEVSGPVRVVLPPRVTGRILSRLAEGFVLGSRDPAAFFLTRAGARVSEKLHLIDDGGLPGGTRTRAFDDRGAPPFPVVLIREGSPTGRYFDVEDARRRDRPPTGHALEGRLVPSNLMLRGGTRSINALLSEHNQRTLVLDDVESLDGLDLLDGTLRVRASGLVQRGSTVEGVARRIVLRGDLTEVLSRVVDIASDTDRIEHVDAPGVLLEGLTAE